MNRSSTPTSHHDEDAEQIIPETDNEINLSETIDLNNTTDTYHQEPELTEANSTWENSQNLPMDPKVTESEPQAKVSTRSPRSPDRLFARQKEAHRHDNILDKSLDLSSTATLQEEKAGSRRSSFSNYSLSQPVSHMLLSQSIIRTAAVSIYVYIYT